MREDEMVAAVEGAVRTAGSSEQIRAAGVFFPRGHTGGGFLGGVAGSLLPGVIGDVAMEAGQMGGRRAAGRTAGLPERMLLGVSDAHVYGFEVRRGHSDEPGEMVFAVPREGLEVRVHQRVNVRILELIAGDSRIELEGNRLGPLHTHDVFAALSPR